MAETAGESRNAAKAGFWQERWRDGQTGWDQGGRHSRLDELLMMARGAGFLPAGARILEPGCGRAHNGAALAAMGYAVTSFDLVGEAVAEARRLYRDVARLELDCQDATLVRPGWRGRFQAIFDRAFLCALPEALRRQYLRASWEHLAPGGVFLTLPFTEVRIAPADGPPFAIPMAALSALMTPYYSLVEAAEQDLTPEAGGKIAREAACVWRRRDRPLVESGL